MVLVRRHHQRGTVDDGRKFPGIDSWPPKCAATPARVADYNQVRVCGLRILRDRGYRIAVQEHHAEPDLRVVTFRDEVPEAQLFSRLLVARVTARSDMQDVKF